MFKPTKKTLLKRYEHLCIKTFTSNPYSYRDRAWDEAIVWQLAPASSTKVMRYSNIQNLLYVVYRYSNFTANANADMTMHNDEIYILCTIVANRKPKHSFCLSLTVILNDLCVFDVHRCSRVINTAGVIQSLNWPTPHTAFLTSWTVQCNPWTLEHSGQTIISLWGQYQCAVTLYNSDLIHHLIKMPVIVIVPFSALVNLE